MVLYVAGKVSKNSQFGTHYWRDDFVAELEKLSGMQLTHLDPLAFEDKPYDPAKVFAKDCWLIQHADRVIVYLSDDISVGGSQEIIIAKYFGKAVIGYAPIGGKFNTPTKEFRDEITQDYIDPFVYSTCDRVCGTTEEVAAALNEDIAPKSIDLINEAAIHADAYMELQANNA